MLTHRGDELEQNGKYKYQEAKDEVNSRNDNSIAFLTTKREMENYLHLDAINKALQPIVGFNLTFEVSDDCDVENQIKQALSGQSRIKRRTIKHWLNEDAANNMTLENLKERAGYEEIKSWFTAISDRVA